MKKTGLHWWILIGMTAGGILGAIYLDMCRTSVNIQSDSCVAWIVAHTEGEVDDSVLRERS